VVPQPCRPVAVEFLDFESLQILRDSAGDVVLAKHTNGGCAVDHERETHFDRYDGSYEVTVGNYGAVLARVATKPYRCPTTVACALRLSSATWMGSLKTRTVEPLQGHRPARLQGTSAVRAEFRFDLPPDRRYIHRTRKLLLRQRGYRSRSGAAACQCAYCREWTQSSRLPIRTIIRRF